MKVSQKINTELDHKLDHQAYTLAQQLVQLILTHKKQLIIAESCTGGLLGSYITSVSGASQILYGGLIVYSNHMKSLLLHIPGQLIQTEGAVSIPVVSAMAKNSIKIYSKANVALAISGVAGPAGGTPAKPVGTVFIAYSDKYGTLSQELHLHGSRIQIQRQSCIAAIQLLLQNLS